MDLTKALEKINDHLGQYKEIEGYLPAASTYLIATVVTFMGNVAVKAVDLAVADKRTAVDRGDVQEAYDIESGQAGLLDTWLLALAGLLGGGAIATGVAVALTPPAEWQWVWWLAIALTGIAALILLIKVFPKKKTRGRRK